MPAMKLALDTPTNDNINLEDGQEAVLKDVAAYEIFDRRLEVLTMRASREVLRIWKWWRKAGVWSSNDESIDVEKLPT